MRMSTSPNLPLAALRRTVHERKSSSKVLLPWTTIILVPETLRANLHVLEDDRIVSWLGRRKFVELCIHDSSGWQDEVNSLVLHIYYLHIFVLLCICVFFCVMHIIFFCIFLILCVYLYFALLFTMYTHIFFAFTIWGMYL